MASTPVMKIFCEPIVFSPWDTGARRHNFLKSMG
jgi:hypothetical protein